MERKDCPYRGSMRIGKERWDWCYFFNAKISDIHCEDCRHSYLSITLDERPLIAV